MYKVELRGVNSSGYGFTQTYDLEISEVGDFLTRLIPDLESTSVFELKMRYVR